ncbi:hypothetical protein M0R45_016272 [Rubus argutus]|uniref:Uncharacterized protein n=1 Tax=Rubus argutus TaxID=59490 RepID=A0AAW1XU44_RUBAR
MPPPPIDSKPNQSIHQEKSETPSANSLDKSRLCLATFSGEDAHVLSEAKEEAVRTIVEFVKTPDLFQCDLLGMPPVAQLEKDAKHALAYQLLKIFNFDSEAGCLLEVSGRKFYSSEKLCRSTQRVFGKEQ